MHARRPPRVLPPTFVALPAAALGMVLGPGLGGPAPAAAQATLTVDTVSDAGTGSLRQVLSDAEPGSTIVFDLGMQEPVIGLEPPPLRVEDDGLVVDGSGAPGLELQGDGTALLDLVGGGQLTVIDVSQSAGVLRLDGVLTYQTGEDTLLAVEVGDLDREAGQTGALVKTGEARLTVTGPLRYSDGTTVREGVLVLRSDAAVDPEGAFAIEQPGTLRIDLGASDSAIDGPVGGAGTLQVAGDGATLILSQGELTGALAFDRAATTVLDTANVVRGDVSFGDTGSTLRLESSGDVAGDIEGDGILEVAPGPGGRVALLGRNAHGETRVESGLLVGDSDSLVGSIRNDAAVEIDQSADGRLDALLTGPGTLTKVGAGAVTIDRDQDYSGPTVVAEGGLVLRAQLTSTPVLAVDSGATLEGTGDAPGAELFASGVVSPSSLDDAFEVGRANLLAGSVLEVDVQPDGAGGGRSDRLEAADDVTFDAASTVRVRPGPGDYETPVTFTVAAAGDELVLPATSILEEVPRAFLDLSLGRSGDGRALEVTVQGALDGLVDYADTANQAAVARHLQAELDARPRTDTALDRLAGDLMPLTETEVPAAYEALGGESLSAVTTAHLAAAQRFERALHRRARGDAWGAAGALLGTRLPDVAAPPSGGARPVPSGSGPWSEVWGGVLDVDGGGGSADVEAWLAGANLGVDRRLGGVLVGVAGGYVHADVGLSGREGDVRSDGAQGALYGAWSRRAGYLSAVARGSWMRARSERELAIGPGAAERAEADFDTLAFGGGAEGGLNVLRVGPLVLQTVASVDWTWLDREAFRESGAAGALDVRSEKMESLRSGAGLRLAGRFGLEDGSVFVPELRARWLHEFLDRDRVVRARLAGGVTGGGFRVEGAELSRDTWLAGMAWSTVFAGSIRGEAAYEVLADCRQLAHLFSLGVRVSF